MNTDILKQKLAGRSGTSSEYINAALSPVFAQHRPDKSGGFADAAVLIPLQEAASGLELLLTERASHLKEHAGQISFPGGRAEAADRTLRHTALREAHEEIGLPPAQVEIVAHLPRMYTISMYDVDPVVGLINGDFQPIPDSSEVASVFSVPLDFFLHSDNHLQIEREILGHNRTMTEFHFSGHRIWGATAMLLVSLAELLWASDDPVKPDS